MHIFLPSQKESWYQSIIQLLISKERNQTCFYCCEKQFQYACVVYKKSFIAAACTLKLQVINPSYLKKLSEWYNLYETHLPVSTITLKIAFFKKFTECTISQT